MLEFEDKFNEELIVLSSKISNLGYKLFDKIEIHENEHDKILISIMAHKILNDFDACIIMFKNGFVDQIFEIIRVILEKIFMMRALMIHPDKVKDFFYHQEYQREGAIKKAYKLHLISEKEKNSYIQGLSKRKYTSIANWAELANMTDFYNREYTVFSDYIHFSTKSISECLEIENNRIKSIDMHPNEKMRYPGLCTACYYALLTIETICQAFCISCCECESLKAKWAELSKDYYQED